MTARRPGPMSTTAGLAAIVVALAWLVTFALFLVMATVATVFAADLRVTGIPAWFFVAIGAWAMVQASVGAVIGWRRPDNAVGRLMQLSGLLIVSTFLGFLVSTVRTNVAGPGDLLGGVAGWWAGATIILTIFVAFPLLAAVFPDGRLASPRLRLPLGVAIGTVLLTGTGDALVPGSLGEGLADNPFGILGLPVDTVQARGFLEGLSTLALLVGVAVAVASFILRWRGGSGAERAQLKWPLAAVAVTAVIFFDPLGGSQQVGDLSAILLIVGFMLLPISIGIAILRYRLYDIDRIISRTLGWAVVTGILVAVFAGLVIGLQALLDDVTQGDTLAVAASTLVAFALFQPVRRRVQGFVDRRFDRARYDAQRTADAFAERLTKSREIDIDRLATTLTATTETAVRPSAVGLWLREGRSQR